MSEEDVKVKIEELQFIKFSVSGQDSTIVFFRTKKNTKMSKVKKSFANRTGLKVGTIRLIFAGERVADEDTPSSLGMEEGDTLEVYVEQTGGSNESMDLFNGILF